MLTIEQLLQDQKSNWNSGLSCLTLSSIQGIFPNIESSITTSHSIRHFLLSTLPYFIVIEKDGMEDGLQSDSCFWLSPSALSSGQSILSDLKLQAKLAFLAEQNSKLELSKRLLHTFHPPLNYYWLVGTHFYASEATLIEVMGIEGLNTYGGCKLYTRKIKGIRREIRKIDKVSCGSFRKVACSKRISAQLKGVAAPYHSFSFAFDWGGAGKISHFMHKLQFILIIQKTSFCFKLYFHDCRSFEKLYLYS